MSQELIDKPGVTLATPGTLDPDDVTVAGEIISRYKHEKGALMPVLQDVNAAYHYLPEKILRYVAKELDLHLSQVFQVATFYNAFSLQPRGKYVVRVCIGTSCHVRGSGRLLDNLQSTLGIAPGETTENRLFTLETVRCLGCCALSPVVVVGKKTYGRLRPDALPKLLASCEKE